MNSLVLDLQEEVLKKDSDILNALRKAHLIASKLQLKEFDDWIQYELKGYEGCSREEIPNYRKVKGVLKAFNPYHGWISAQCGNNETERLICEQKLNQSIGEIQQLFNQSTNGSVIYRFSAKQMEIISSMFDTDFPMEFALHISSHLLLSIVDQVKNTLLEWTIQLESEGIIGDNMRFNQEEKENAKNIPQQVINYYGTVVHGDVSQSQIVSGNNHKNEYSVSSISDAISEIRTSLKTETLSKDDMDSALELLEEISSKLDQNKKPSIVKATFIGLKDFLINTGANITATLVLAKMQSLF